MSAIDPANEPASLVGLIDGLIDQGVHIAGDLSIGLADLDLIRVTLRLLVASEETAQRTGVAPGRAARAHAGEIHTPAGERLSSSGARSSGPRPMLAPQPATGGSARPGTQDPADREQLARGVSQLVLTVIEVVHDLIERQAIRRVEAGSLTDEQVERLGLALQALEDRMADVKEAFGVTDEDLNLDLGPLGRLR